MTSQRALVCGASKLLNGKAVGTRKFACQLERLNCVLVARRVIRCIWIGDVLTARPERPEARRCRHSHAICHAKKEHMLDMYLGQNKKKSNLTIASCPSVPALSHC